MFLVPIDEEWLADSRLGQVLAANLRDRVLVAVNEARQTREFRGTPDAIKVMEGPNFVTVEVKGGKAVAIEKGVKPHQMRYLEGSTVPVKTPLGSVIRRATPLSMMKGKWQHPGTPPKKIVKQAIEKAMASSAEAVVDTKRELMSHRPARIREILGMGR